MKVDLRILCAVVGVMVAGSRAEAVIVNGSGAVTASGSDVGVYLGAGAFYGRGYTGTRVTCVNVEGGLPWNGHQSLTRLGYMPVTGGAIETTDNHPTGVTSVMGGRGNRPLDQGIAYGSRIYAGTVATFFVGTSFGLTPESVGSTYAGAMGGFVPVGEAPGSPMVRADVVNSSWQAGGTWGGQSVYCDQVDTLAARYGTVVVAAAGNGGPASNSIAAPAASLNVISVAALASDNPPETNPSYNFPADFSSRSPSSIRLPGQIETQRAAVSISAPGAGFSVAGYNGEGTPQNWYYFNSNGTSYASPTVAGGAALLVDVGYDRFVTGAVRQAIDGRVIKAVLLNSADKTRFWDNGQTRVGGVTMTTQALDWAAGTGRMNLGAAFRQYTAGTTGNVSPDAGAAATVQTVGWDYDTVSAENPVDLFNFPVQLLGGSTFTATLTWFVEGMFDDGTYASSLTELANLSLEVYRLTGPGAAGGTRVAVSDTATNTTEHLSFTLLAPGWYQLRVNYLGQTLGMADGATPYAVAWNATQIPEPGGVMGVLVVAGAMWGRRRR